MALNFNRFIHIQLYGQRGTFEIRTPLTGRKPDIEVHGILMSADYAQDFEVRIRNLYSSVDLTLFNKIQVMAGYVGKAALVLDGSISIIYTEEPGPDRVTVIKCLVADAELLLNATCNIELPAGSTLQTVLDTITQSMNQAVVPDSTNAVKTIWKKPGIDPAITALVSNSTLSWNGAVKDIMPELKARFPSVMIMIKGNQFVAFDPKSTIGTGRETPIYYLQSPPNYTAGRVILTAPWEPGLQPGDTIRLISRQDVGTRDLSTAAAPLKNLWRVISVQFDLSTVGSQNKMIVTGV